MFKLCSPPDWTTQRLVQIKRFWCTGGNAITKRKALGNPVAPRLHPIPSELLRHCYKGPFPVLSTSLPFNLKSFNLQQLQIWKTWVQLTIVGHRFSQSSVNWVMFPVPSAAFGEVNWSSELSLSPWQNLRSQASDYLTLASFIFYTPMHHQSSARKLEQVICS